MPSPQKREQTKIAKNLELLSDFVSDMAVVRMKLTERGLKRVDVMQCKVAHAKSTNCVQYVKGPSTFLACQLSKGAQASILSADI